LHFQFLVFTLVYCLSHGGYAFIGVRLFVSRIKQKLLKKPLDFGGNPDHFTLRLGLRFGLGLGLGWGQVVTRVIGYVLPPGLCLVVT